MSSVQFQPLPPTAFAPPVGPDAPDAPAGGFGGPSAAPATSADGVAASWAMRAIPVPVPGDGCHPAPCDGTLPGQGSAASGGFLGLIDKLVSQLGTMIGNMTGGGSTADDPSSAGTGNGLQTLATLFGAPAATGAASTSSPQPIAFE